MPAGFQRHPRREERPLEPPGTLSLKQYYEQRNQAKVLTSDNPENLSLLRRMLNWLQIQPEDHILDIGCSDGYFLDRIAAAFPFEHGEGIEIAEHSVRIAAERLKNRSNIHVSAGSADALPFAGQSFNKIIVNEVIEHVPDDRAVLREVARVSKPGARVYITAPNAFSEMLPLFRRHCRRLDEAEGHLRRYSLLQFSDICSSHGLELINYRYGGFWGGYLWQSLVIYNAPVRALGHRLVGLKKSGAVAASDASIETNASPNMLAQIPFFAMRLSALIDEPFRKSSRCMGFHALLVKR